jgi:hypothetical protein
MRYRVEIAASAKADIREAARWLTEQASPAVATRWLAGIYKAMSTLEKQPGRQIPRRNPRIAPRPVENRKTSNHFRHRK